MKIRSQIMSVMVTFCILMLMVTARVNAQPTDPEKPNILFIMTDQQRFDALQFVQNELDAYDGKTKVRTPNLDKLATEGAYFRNAYTNCAVCAPARATLRTGLTLEGHGGQSNGLVEEHTYTQSPQLFKDKIESAVSIDHILVEDRGYVDEYYGKWHIPERFAKSRDGSTDIIQYNSYDFATGTFTYEGFSRQWSNLYQGYLSYFDNQGEISKTFPEGTQSNTYSKYPYHPKGYDLRVGYPTNTPLTSPPFESTSQPNVMGMDELAERYTPSGFTGYIGLQSLGRLIQGTDPFFLTISFHNPHAPMVATKKYFDYYFDNRNELFIPPSIIDNSSNTGYGTGSKNDPEKVREWMACYYAMVEEIDEWVGKLMDTLDTYPDVRDNTLIIFTSDHGEMLGAHGLNEKNKFLEESAHIPLIVKHPEITPGTVVEESVSLLDLFSTVLDYGNATTYDNSHGTSLRRFIEQTSYNKDYDEAHIVTEWDFRDPNGSSLTRSLGGEVNFHSKKGNYKLMMTKKASSSKIDMLYDIEADPYEMNNLIGTNGSTASDFVIGKTEHLKALLIDWMIRLDGPDKIYSDPKWNANEGSGDIEEIRSRRGWRAMDLWVCDTSIMFGSPVNVEGTWTRNEWVYLGRTTSGSANITSVAVEGADASLFTVSNFTSGTINTNEYKKIKVQFAPATQDYTISEATLRIQHDTGEDIVINLVNTDYPVSSLPGKPALIYPENNATGINVTTALEWLAGDNVEEHEVYFGTTNPPALIATQTGTSYLPDNYEPNTTYYWQIKEKNQDGVAEGEVWSFTTLGPPNNAFSPGPSNGSTGESTTRRLSWIAGSYAESHDVYFGTTNPPPFIKNQIGNSYTPDGPLDFETTYYWKIDEINDVDTTEGALWSFSTRAKDASGIVVLSTCDSKTGWGGSNLKGVNTTENKEGSGCLRAEGSSTNDFQITFDPAFNTGIAESDAQLVFWYYISDLSQFDVANQIEIGSGGKADLDEYNWQPDNSTLQNGWNLIRLDFSDANKLGNPNLSTINWMRIYRKKLGSVVTMIDNIRIIDKSVTIPAPNKAEISTPADQSKNNNLYTSLNWTSGLNAEYHLVYFGTTNPPELIGEQPGEIYYPANLDSATTYYWRVDEVNLIDTTAGDVWSFNTVDGVTGYQDVLQNNTFKLSPNPSRGIVKLDLEILEDPVDVCVYDIQGRIVYHTIADKLSNYINLTNLHKGRYIIEVKNKRLTSAAMIILE